MKKQSRSCLLACLALAAALLAAPVFAHQAESGGAAATGSVPASKLLEQQSALRALRTELADTEKTDPKAAIARYQKFWEENSDLTPAVGLQTCDVIARIYHIGVKDDAAALKTCDWGIAQYSKSRDRILLIVEKAGILLDLKRSNEVTDLVDKNWSLMLISGPIFAGRMLPIYGAAMDAQLKGPEAVATVGKTFRRFPVYLGDENWSVGDPLYAEIQCELIAERRYDNALSWAKLRFMLCPFSDTAITRASAAILEVETARVTPTGNVVVPTANAPAHVSQQAARAVKPPTSGAPRVFGESPPPSEEAADKTHASQVDLPGEFNAALTTRLRGMPLPTAPIDPDGFRMILTTLDRKTEENRMERITLLLTLGSYRAAMDEAVRYRKELPGSVNGLRQIARVFKASDLGVGRANRFMEFTLAAQGTDPLIEFYREFPAEAAEN